MFLCRIADKSCEFGKAVSCVSQYRKEHAAQRNGRRFHGGFQPCHSAFGVVVHRLGHAFRFAVAFVHLVDELVKLLRCGVDNRKPTRRSILPEYGAHGGQLLFLAEPLHFVSQFRDNGRHLPWAAGIGQLNAQCLHGGLRLCLLFGHFGHIHSQGFHRLGGLFRRTSQP